MEMAESSLFKQHVIDPVICIRCNTCEATCPVGAITHDDRNYVVDAEKCNHCMACVPPCPTGSIDNWRNMPRAKAYSLTEQLSWDELPEELSTAALEAAGAAGSGVRLAFGFRKLHVAMRVHSLKDRVRHHAHASRQVSVHSLLENQVIDGRRSLVLVDRPHRIDHAARHHDPIADFDVLGSHGAAISEHDLVERRHSKIVNFNDLLLLGNGGRFHDGWQQGAISGMLGIEGHDLFASLDLTDRLLSAISHRDLGLASEAEHVTTRCRYRRTSIRADIHARRDYPATVSTRTRFTRGHKELHSRMSSRELTIVSVELVNS